MRRLILTVLALAGAAIPTVRPAAQTPTPPAPPLPTVATSTAGLTVDPGMSREQVVAVLGQPVSQRTSGTFTYLFYRNGCEKSCGMNDLVVLEGGKVIDAIFRSPARGYSGRSSSPGQGKGRRLARQPSDTATSRARAEKPPATAIPAVVNVEVQVAPVAPSPALAAASSARAPAPPAAAPAAGHDTAARAAVDPGPPKPKP